MHRRSLLALIIGAPFAVTACVSADPGADFSAVAGTWNGQQVRADGSSRPMTVTIAADGSYSWVSGGSRVTNGRLRGSSPQFDYVNNAGSRGIVTVASNQLVFRNTRTGDNYRVTLTR